MSNRGLDHICRRMLRAFDPVITERPTTPLPDLSAEITATNYLHAEGYIASGPPVQLTAKGLAALDAIKRSRA